MGGRTRQRLGKGRIQPGQLFQQPHFPILLSHHLSPQLLQYNPKQRLGSGGGGMAKLKSHSFFSTIPWNKLVG